MSKHHKKSELDTFQRNHSENDDDDDSDSDASPIELSFLDKFADRTANPGRKSVRFTETDTSPTTVTNVTSKQLYNVIDTTESTTGSDETTTDYGRISECTLKRLDASERSCSDSDEEAARLSFFRTSFLSESTLRRTSYHDAINLSLSRMSRVSEKGTSSSSSDNDHNDASSDDGSEYRYSCSVFGDADDESDEFNDARYDYKDYDADANANANAKADASVNGNAFESQPKRRQSKSSEQGERRASVFSVRGRRQSIAIRSSGQERRRQSEASKKSDGSGRRVSKIPENRRKSVASVVKKILVNVGDDEDDKISRRKSRTSMASKAVNEIVVQDDDEDDEEAMISRRKSRMSLAGINEEKITELDNIENSTLLREMYHILCLAVPSMVIEITTSIPYMLTASYLGRNFAPIYLVGYSLANSLGNISTNMLLLGVFTASDTLSPQAFGAKNYDELGLIAIRGFILAHVVTMPVTIILLIWMTPILVGLGQSVDAAELATDWYRVSAFSLPAVIFIQVIWKFLSAQNILRPLAITSVLCAALLTPLSVTWFGNKFGYLGTSGSKLFVTICQALILPLYLKFGKPQHPETWTGISKQSIKLALDRDKFRYFLSLCLGGILASVEYLFWEIVTIVVGTIGPVELAIHTVNASVSFMTFHLGVGFMVAICTRIGNFLPVSVKRAQSICVWGSLFGCCVFAAVNLLVYTFEKPIISIFTNDPDVIAGCHRTWLDLLIFQLSINIFYVNSGIAIAMGKQWTLGVLTGLILFGLGLPLICYFAIIKNGGIEAVWFWMWPPYVLLNVILPSIYVQADWEKISSFIRVREGMI